MKERLLYPDILRIIAIIALHVSGGYLYFQAPEGGWSWWKVSLT